MYAGHSKEIGWSKLSLASVENNPLKNLENLEVLHWHGDTFNLPTEAELLASSAVYPNQAFRIGSNILALQFHAEVEAERLEKWLIGHTCELRQANIDIAALRADNQQYAAALEAVSVSILQEFLKHIQTS